MIKCISTYFYFPIRKRHTYHFAGHADPINCLSVISLFTSKVTVIKSLYIPIFCHDAKNIKYTICAKNRSNKNCDCPTKLVFALPSQNTKEIWKQNVHKKDD